MPFVHLQVQSGYSLLSSAVKITELVRHARSIGCQALALTDENVMYGTVAFYKACVKAGIKPIIGLTLSVLEDDERENSAAFPFIFLARNNIGYQNLLKMSSIVQTKAKGGLKKKWLPRYSEGLIVLTPGQKGMVEQYILENRTEEGGKVIRFLQETFGEENVYLSIQRHGNEEEELNERLIQLARSWQVCLASTNDVRYLVREQWLAHDCLLAIKQGAKLEDEGRERYGTDQHYLKTAEEMDTLFSDLPEALENTVKISQRCNVELKLGEFALPKYPVSNGSTADEYLKELCEEGLRKRGIGQELFPLYAERLRYELSIIRQMNFSDYFLIVWDFMKYAHDHGIITGPGRGSAAGALVSYVLNITDIDPIKYNLLFERFLNPERVSMPDIDIDFPDHRRDEVIRYVAEKYGALHVAQIITFGTLAAKAAVRDVGRVLGVPVAEVDIISKFISTKPGITLAKAYEQSGELRAYLQQSALRKKLFQVALLIEGLPRHTSTHAAGVVISEKPLTDVTAIQEGHQGVYLSQFDMESLESVGLLKMDFLGLRNLSILDRILQTIKKETGRVIDLANVPLQDPKTYSLLAAGDTTGIFQLESEGMRKVLQQLKPTNLEDIAAVNALYRPGPMENIPIYIQRKHNDSAEYMHPDLKEILHSTYGVIVYQEQIMQIASKMAGFSLGEADLLRRAVSKKKKEVLDEERAHFVKGCIQNGYDAEIAHSLYDLIVRFADYGFNRSHAVAYSMIAYQLAYLKANFSIHFFAALLTSAIGNETKTAQYVHEARSKGIFIFPPSINKSAYDFRVEKNGIRFSLAAVKHVGITALKEIFKARKHKHFTDLFDFCMRVSMKAVNRRALESLVFFGCFDEFGEDRASIEASIDVAIEHAELIHPEDGEGSLFLDGEFSLKPKYVNANPISLEEKLKREKEALGFYLSSHPVTPYRSAFKKIHAQTIYEALSNKSSFKLSIGAFLSSERVIRTKKGEQMAFFTLSDETGEIGAVAFPKIYNEYKELLIQGAVLMLSGKLEARESQVQFIIQEAKKAEELQEILHPSANVLYLKIEEKHKQQGGLPLIQQILQTHKGTVPVIVHYENEKRTVKLPEAYSVHPDEKCLQKLMSILGRENVVLKTF